MNHETLETATFDDAVLAYYAELMEQSPQGHKPAIEELDQVCHQAWEFLGWEKPGEFTDDGPIYRWSHPMGRLWVGGLLDSNAYFEWAHAKELAKAKHDVDALLSRRRQVNWRRFGRAAVGENG